MVDARALVEKDVETLFTTLNKAMAERAGFRKTLEAHGEKDAVTLAFAIARKVVYHEIATREETIFEVIHEALKQVPDQKSATLRVSPADYERLKARAAAFTDDAASLEEMRMQPDKSIHDGDCIIDTPFGMIDARIEKRLQAVESALKSRLK
jgi:flagellar assembly protein FliH